MPKFARIEAQTEASFEAQLEAIDLEPTTGLEPVTYALRMRCSTN